MTRFVPPMCLQEVAREPAAQHGMSGEQHRLMEAHMRGATSASAPGTENEGAGGTPQPDKREPAEVRRRWLGACMARLGEPCTCAAFHSAP